MSTVPKGLAAPALHPMTVGDVLDGSFRLMRANAAILLPGLLLFVLPGHIVGLASTLSYGDLENATIISGTGSTSLATIGSDSVAGIALSLMASLLSLFSTALVGALVCQVLIASHSGEVLTSKEILIRVAHKWWPLLASWIVVHLVEVSGLLVVGLVALLVGIGASGDAGFVTVAVGAFPALLMFLVAMNLSIAVVPCVMAENLGPIAAVRRSWRLIRRRFWPVLGISLLAGLVASMVGQVAGGIPMAMGFIISGPAGWVILALASGFVALISLAFTGLVASMLYLDTRIRTEGLDLQITADRLMREVPLLT